jgi:hypothetical protein
MRKSILITLLVLIVVLGAFGTVSAQGPDEPDGDERQIPRCSDIPDAQEVPGKELDSACRIPVVPVDMPFDSKLLSVYRSGWTNKWTSESDSDLWEDSIRVSAYLYLNGPAGWQFEDSCTDSTSGHHAACRTYGGGDENKQNGYHYFHKSGYEDQSFQTTDHWYW